MLIVKIHCRSPTVRAGTGMEISRTPLAELVRTPAAVRGVDWIDHIWPSSSSAAASTRRGGEGEEEEEEEEEGARLRRLRRRARYPRTQLYCLMGTEGELVRPYTAALRPLKET